MVPLRLYMYVRACLFHEITTAFLVAWLLNNKAESFGPVLFFICSLSWLEMRTSRSVGY